MDTHFALTMAKAATMVAEWRQRNPQLASTTPLTCLEHIKEECGEIEQLLTSGRRAQLAELAYEIADVQILLFDLANMLDIVLPLAFQMKMSILAERIYDVKTSVGTVKHRKNWRRANPAEMASCQHCTAPAFATRVVGEPLTVCAHHYQIALEQEPVKLLETNE